MEGFGFFVGSYGSSAAASSDLLNVPVVARQWLFEFEYIYFSFKPISQASK
jgi:hypothetical protein